MQFYKLFYLQPQIQFIECELLKKKSHMDQ